MHKIIVFLAVLSLLSGCGKGKQSDLQTLPSEEEERIFMIVYEPGAEGRYQDAVSAADSLLSIYEMSDTLRAYILSERTVAYFNMGDIVHGNTSADTLIEFSRDAGINEMLIQGLLAKGMSYKRNEKPDSAIMYYNQALDIALEDKNTEMEQTLAEVIAIVYAETKRIPEALKFSERALELAEEMNDSLAILQSASTLASITLKGDDRKKALEKILPYRNFSGIGSPIHTIKLLTPVFYAYLESDSIDQARNTMAEIDSAVSLIPENHEQSVIAKIAKAKLLGYDRRYKEQYELYLQVDTLQPIGRKPEITFNEKAKCLADMGRSDEAFTMMAKAYDLLDSTRESDVEKELSDLSVRYDTLTKQVEIERLSGQRWMMLNIITICLIVVVVLIALILFSRQRYRRRLYQESQEQYIRGLEQERQRIARELHDDIAGELIGLKWQATSLSEEETSARISAIGERVRRLSHEMMPPEFSSLTLCQLLVDMMQNFNKTHVRPKMTITDEGSFDWSALSPQENYELYRIIQESVNNALKHSDASAIRITLNGDDRFELSIENDGINGKSESKGGIGTYTLKARAQIIGAQVTTMQNEQSYIQIIRQK